MIKFLIHKPIAVIMTALGILILGVLASTYVPISLMPDIDIQEITVQVNATNSSAYELENAVVKPLRNNLLQLNHYPKIYLLDIRYDCSILFYCKKING